MPIYSFCKKIALGVALNAKLAIQSPKALFYRVAKTQVWLPKLFTLAAEGWLEHQKITFEKSLSAVEVFTFGCWSAL